MDADEPLLAPAWSGTARVVRGDDVLEEVARGPAGPGGPPCTADLRFQAGSISKLVVAVCTLHLVERRALGLDDPVGRWVENAPRAWDGITVRQLLAQTSGMGHWGDLPGLGASLLSDPPPPAELVAMVRSAPLVSPPGREWHYSGPGFLLAALVVEGVTGLPYGEAADRLVLRPAGLRATTSGRHPTVADRVALPHRSGRPLPLSPGFTQLPGTGDLWTTVADLVTLSRALRAGELLRPASAAALWTRWSTVPPTAGGGMVVPEAYGFGTFLGRLAGRPARLNPGDNPGYQSLLAHLPEEDVDVVVLCNEDAPAVERALADLRSLSSP